MRNLIKNISNLINHYLCEFGKHNWKIDYENSTFKIKYTSKVKLEREYKKYYRICKNCYKVEYKNITHKSVVLHGTNMLADKWNESKNHSNRIKTEIRNIKINKLYEITKRNKKLFKF